MAATPESRLRNLRTPGRLDRGQTAAMMRKPRATPGAAALALALAAVPAMSQTPPPPKPCSTAEHRQFDFWVGPWDVFAPDGKKAGDNRIEAIDGGCAASPARV
jgi:hypothetical protein